MITNIAIENFKSLKKVDIELRNLNLLTGLNGSGKSSLIQVLLLLRQSKNLVNEQLINLSGALTDVGKYFDAKYRNVKTPQIDAVKFKLKFENQTGLLVEETISLKHKDNDGILVNIGYANTNRINLIQRIYIEQGGQDIADNVYLVENQLKEQSLFNNKFQYLNTERLFLKKNTYDPSVSEVIGNKMLGNQGEHTAFYLFTYGVDKKVENEGLHHPKAKSAYLIDQVNAWLSEISPNVYVDVSLKKEKIEINFGYGNELYKPKNVGFGLSYVLPVVVALLTAEKDKLIIIENPESHIHPRGQAELGRLLAAAAQTGAQIIVETHSDHILNGVRVAVKERPEIKDTVGIFFHDRVEKNGEQYSEITSITIDKQGELSEYPDNFLDEWSNQLFKLV